MDMPAEIRVRRDWPKSLALAAICAGLVAISWYGIRLEPEGSSERRFHSFSFVIFPIFLLFTPFVLYRLIIPLGAPIRADTAGFVDLRAGSKRIPWTEMRNVVRRGAYVSITLNRSFAKDYPWSWTQKLLKSTRKSAGPTHLLVADWCLASTHTDILDIIASFRDGPDKVR